MIISGYQWLSVVISAWLPVAIYGSQWLPVVIYGSQRLPVVIYGSQWLPVVIYGSQWLSVVIYGSQWLSVVICGSQWLSGLPVVVYVFNFTLCAVCSTLLFVQVAESTGVVDPAVILEFTSTTWVPEVLHPYHPSSNIIAENLAGNFYQYTTPRGI